MVDQVPAVERFDLGGKAWHSCLGRTIANEPVFFTRSIDGAVIEIEEIGAFLEGHWLFSVKGMATQKCPSGHINGRGSNAFNFSPERC